MRPEVDADVACGAVERVRAADVVVHAVDADAVERHVVGVRLLVQEEPDDAALGALAGEHGDGDRGVVLADLDDGEARADAVARHRELGDLVGRRECAVQN